MVGTSDNKDRRQRAAQIAQELEARVQAEGTRPEVRRFFEAGVAVARAVADGADRKSETFRRDVTALKNLNTGMMATVRLLVDAREMNPVLDDLGFFPCLERCGTLQTLCEQLPHDHAQLLCFHRAGTVLPSGMIGMCFRLYELALQSGHGSRMMPSAAFCIKCQSSARCRLNPRLLPGPSIARIGERRTHRCKQAVTGANSRAGGAESPLHMARGVIHPVHVAARAGGPPARRTLLPCLPPPSPPPPPPPFPPPLPPPPPPLLPPPPLSPPPPSPSLPPPSLLPSPSPPSSSLSPPPPLLSPPLRPPPPPPPLPSLPSLPSS